MKLIHYSPLGALEIPTVPVPVEPGEPFDVPDEIANSLLEQSDLYQAAPAPRRAKLAELREQATELGIDITGLKKAADIQAAIANAAGSNSGEEQS